MILAGDLCSHNLRLYWFAECQPGIRETGYGTGPGGRVGRDPKANDIHALYGAGSVMNR